MPLPNFQSKHISVAKWIVVYFTVKQLVINLHYVCRRSIWAVTFAVGLGDFQFPLANFQSFGVDARHFPRRWRVNFSDRDMAPANNTKSTKNRIIISNEKRWKLIELTRKLTNIFTKRTLELSRTHNEESRPREFNAHRIY